MPATSLRYTVRSSLVTLLRTATATASHDGGQLQVELGWPGDQIKEEAIWLEASDGTMNVPVFRGAVSPSNPTARDDRFTIPVQIKAGYPGQTLDVAEARVVALFGFLELVPAGDPKLGNIAALIGGAVIKEVNGPATGYVKDHGAVSYIRAVVDCHARESA